jgi:hypothetical protein
MLLVLEQTAIDVVVQLMIPESADVHTCNFWRFEDLK